MLNGETPPERYGGFVRVAATDNPDQAVDISAKEKSEETLVDVACPEHNNLHGHAEG